MACLRAPTCGLNGRTVLVYIDAGPTESEGMSREREGEGERERERERDVNSRIRGNVRPLRLHRRERDMPTAGPMNQRERRAMDPRTPVFPQPAVHQKMVKILEGLGSIQASRCRTC